MMRFARLLVVLAGLATAANGQSTALSRFQESKAESLLRDHLPCLGCHTLNGEGGRIGPDLTSVGARRSAAYIAAMVADPQSTVPSSVMPRIDLPATTRELVVRYLASRRDSAAAEAPAAEAGEEAEQA